MLQGWEMLPWGLGRVIRGGKVEDAQRKERKGL